jgi:hypothetical protein
MISVFPTLRYHDCSFDKCTFLWAGKADILKAKVFFNCIFKDCDFGMSDMVFRGFTEGAVVNRGSRPPFTRQQAIDEAVRRFYRRRPILTEVCLHPAFDIERQQLVDAVSAEYRKIMAESR